MRSRTLLAPAIALLVAGCLVACTGEAAPRPAPTVEPTYAVTGDGVLRIGTILPTTGATAAVGLAQVAGVEVAVREINELGGVNGVPVEVYHRSSGDATSQTAETSLADLVSKGVDVVVGPSSSALVERLLVPAQAAGIPLISPAATLPALTALDDSGLVFRTIASYAAQGAALAAALGEAKTTRVAYLYLDDDLGADLLASLTDAIEGQGGSLAFSQGFAAGTKNFASIVAATTKAKPDAVVIATPAEAVAQTTALITALTAAGLGGSTLWLTSQNLVDYSPALPAGVLAGVNGVREGAQPDEAFAARLNQSDPTLGSVRYAAEAYDAVVAAALAAVVGGDDGGASIARTLRPVTTRGITCRSFGECLDVLATESDIDYDGVSGPLDLSEAGDVAAGSFGLFTYSEANTFTLARVVIAG